MGGCLRGFRMYATIHAIAPAPSCKAPTVPIEFAGVASLNLPTGLRPETLRRRAATTGRCDIRRTGNQMHTDRYRFLANRQENLDFMSNTSWRSGMVRLGGLEPPTSGATNLRSNQLSYNRTNNASGASGPSNTRSSPFWQAPSRIFTAKTPNRLSGAFSTIKTGLRLP